MANVYHGAIYGAYSKYTRLRIQYTVTQDEVNAISTIEMNLYADRTKGSSQYNKTGRSYWNLTGTGNNAINYDWAVSSLEMHLGYSSIQVPHNEQGDASVTLSGYWYTDRTGSSYIPTEISVSETIALQNIPRKSSISMSTADVESNARVTISGYSDSFRHSVYCYFYNRYEVIKTDQPRGSFDWKIPTSFYNEIRNSRKGNGTIYCETYSGSTFIGKTENSFTVTTNEELCRPTISGTLTDSNEKTVALTGDNTKLIRYHSTAYIQTNAQAKNSASIEAVFAKGIEVINNEIWFENVETNEFEIKARDSRNYEGKDLLTAEMIPYIPLSLSATFFRTLPTTGEVSVTYSGNYFNGQFSETTPNTLDITWYYREKVSSGEENEWIEGGKITPTFEENKIVEDTKELGNIFDYRKEYEFKIEAKDKLTEVVRTASVSMGIPVFNWGKDFFNVNVDAEFQGAIKGATLPVAKTTYNQTQFTQVGEGEFLNNSGLYTVYSSMPAWYHLINVRHRNGFSDGVSYGWQIRQPFDPYGSIQARTQHAGEWNSWGTLYAGISLYENGSGTTGNFSLSPEVASCKTIRVYYNDETYRRQSSKDIDIRLSSTFMLDGMVSDFANSLNYNTSYSISGQEVSVFAYASFNRNYSTGQISGDTSKNVIRVYKVVGFR